MYVWQRRWCLYVCTVHSCCWSLIEGRMPRGWARSTRPSSRHLLPTICWRGPGTSPSLRLRRESLLWGHSLIHTHTHFHSLMLVFLQHVLYVFSFQVKKISTNNSYENTNLNSPHKISLCGKLISKYVCLPTLRYTLFDTWTSLSLSTVGSLQTMR